MIFSGLANAADAPVDSIPPVSFNIGGEVVLEGLQISKCEDQASAADVFANELDDTDDASITADLVTLGFASGTLLTDDASYTFDVSGLATYKKKFNIGASYRYEEASIAFLGYKFLKKNKFMR